MAQIAEEGIQLIVNQEPFSVGTIYYAYDGHKTIEDIIEQKYSEKMQTLRGSRLMFLTNEVAGNGENLAIPQVQYWG